MKIIAAGVGSAFATNGNWQSNYLLQLDEGKNMLFDCGGAALYSLCEQGYSHRNIDAVYVSHYHGDHIHGLEWLGFMRYFDPLCSSPELIFCAPLRSGLTRAFPGMDSIQGKVTSMNDYFDIKSLGKNEKFTYGGTEFQPVQVCHVFDGFTMVPCFGLLFQAGKETVFMTADTQANPNQLKDFYDMATVIIHDCEVLYTKGGQPLMSGVHAHYKQLCDLPAATKEKIWLTHYTDGAEEKVDPKADGFKGFVRKGQVFEF